MLLITQEIMLVIIITLLFISGASIKPTRPILVNPNTQNSPSNFIFYFTLQNNLPQTDYVMIAFTPFSSSVVPQSCMVLEHATTEISNCIDLITGTDLTITSSQVIQFNPNIDDQKTVVIQFNEQLIAGEQYIIQILTDNVLPNLGSITSSFQFFTITDTAVMIEENWNFGQVFLEPRQNNVLSILNRNAMTSNLPGQSFTNLLFQITINQQTPTPKSRLKFIISGGFEFTDSSLITTGSIIGTPPSILSSQIISPNIIITTFDEAFTVGRKFSLRIADYINPMKIASGWISIYHLPQNSMSPLEMSEQSIPITTIPFQPTLTLLTIDRTVPESPIQMYTSTTQYLTLDILLPRKLLSTFIIKIESDVLTIHQGSVYFKTSTVQMVSVNYQYIDAQTFIISGFPDVATGSVLSVTMQVTHPASDKFKFYVSIDIQDQIANPIMYKQITSVSAAVPVTFITALTGNSGEANILTSMSSVPDSQISFTVTPNFDTNDGSSLSLITPAKLQKNTNFNTATSCLVDSVAKPCTIVTDSIYTNITIASHSSQNLFVKAVARNIVINNLQFMRTSSHTLDGVYHLYFSIRISQAVDATRKNQLQKVVVIPQRQQMAGFDLYFSNDLKSLSGNYPNIVRLVSSSIADWSFTVQVYQRRMISIFALQGWKNLFTTINNGEAYPASSNINGFTYTFHEGSSTSLDTQNPLDWDHIDVILNGQQSSDVFSIIFPTTFVSSTVTFQVYVGIYNTDTRTIKYVQMQNQIVRSPAATLLTSKPKQTTNKIQLRGASASSMDNIEVTLTTGSPLQASTYSAAIITVSDWEYFDQTSTFASTSLSSVLPVFDDEQQTPLSLYLPNNQKYLTYIPLKTNPGQTVSTFSVYFDNIRLPYSHDLPYYSIYLTDHSGTINVYNQFINQDKSVFYESYFRSISFTCDVNSLGVTNTFCTVTFNNTMKIQPGAVIHVYFTGMQISTDMCQFKDITNNVDIPVTCQSNVDKNLVTLTLGNTEYLTQFQISQILMYGISIKNNTNIHYIQMDMMDSSGSYIIQYGQRILLTKVQTFMPIQILEVGYSKNNPIVYSQFYVRFTLPRQLKKDQKFAVLMSKDLINLNSIQSKMNIILKDSSGVIIPTIWKLSLKNFMIIFQDLISVLSPSSYTLQIYGIKTPSTIQQDLIGILFLRTYDLVYTVSNNVNSTAQFPSLVSKVDSKITLTTKFNTQGLQHQINIVVINQYALVTYNTIWIVNFPRYYSEGLWNNPTYEKYCTIDDIKIPCEVDPNTPYQIKIMNSPRIVEIGDTYQIKIYGIVCPRADYLNGAADYVTESIFIGISQNETSTSYVEYSELFITDTVINIQNTANYGDIIIKGISSSNMEVLQSTFFVITLQSSQIINAGEYFYITFPQQFNNFNDISMTVVVKQGATDQTYTTSVVNRRIGFQLTGMTISASTQFDIQISSLPTPTNPSTIDMNKLSVIVASSDLSSTQGATLQLHNIVSTMQFVQSGLHIVINEYNTIQVTAGTYSSDIQIKPSTLTTFQSNMKITFVSTSLQFDPSPVYAYLGQQKSKFKVGADQNLIPKVYTYDIIKSETSISAVYASLSKYTVSITNTPVVINIPTTIDVPLGGCSVPYLIQLTNSPFDSIQIQFEYDTELFTMQVFWINEQISHHTLQFSNEITQRWLSFCSSSSLTQSSVVVQPYINGVNQDAYELSSSSISINIINNSTTNRVPSLSIRKVNIQKTYAGFDITTNLNGQIFYELQVNSIQKMGLTSIKSLIKQAENTIIEQQAQYLTQIYVSDRDHRVGVKNVNAGITPLQFDNLLPERKYHLCVLFENQHRSATSRKCIDFNTMSWGTVQKASVKFDGTIYQNQLNKMLCFLVRASESQINQVVNIDGQSCSLSNSPQNYNYLYPGVTQTTELSETLIYFITNKNLTTDPSDTLFRNVFNSSSPYSITSTSLSMGLSYFSINYIEDSKYVTSFDPISAIQKQILNLQLQFDQPIFDEASSSISVGNITLSQAGSVYFLLVFHKRIIKNQVSNHFQIQIQQTQNPSVQNIFNCRDYAGNQPVACRRVVMINDAVTNIIFTNISSDSIYVLYYVRANQYPLRPIFVGQVANVTIDTVAFQNIFRDALLFLLSIYMLMLI